MKDFEKRLKELSIELPEAPKPVAVYVPTRKVGNIVFTSGSECRVNGKLKYSGKLGDELTLEEGYEAAKICMINLLAMAKQEVGNLNQIKQFVKLTGFINSSPGFKKQSQVLNGASELLEEVFGETGKHARAAIATNELPADSPVEIEMIFEVK